MRMRHGVVASSGPSWATVLLDGEEVEVLAPDGKTLNVGGTATVLQDGRRLIAVASTGPGLNPVDIVMDPPGGPALGIIDVATPISPPTRYSGSAITKANYFDYVTYPTPPSEEYDFHADPEGSRPTLPGVDGYGLVNAIDSDVVVKASRFGELYAYQSIKAKRGIMTLVMGRSFTVTPARAENEWHTQLSSTGIKVLGRVPVNNGELHHLVVAPNGAALVIYVNFGAKTGIVDIGGFRLGSVPSRASLGTVPDTADYEGCWLVGMALGNAFVNSLSFGYPTIGFKPDDRAAVLFSNTIPGTIEAGTNPPPAGTYYGSQKILAFGAIAGYPGYEVGGGAGQNVWSDGYVDTRVIAVKASPW